MSVSYRLFHFLHQKLLFSPKGHKNVATDAELRGGVGISLSYKRRNFHLNNSGVNKGDGGFVTPRE